MFCINCGAKLEDGDKFCTNCGTKVMFASETNVPSSKSSDDSNCDISTQINNAKCVKEYDKNTPIEQIDTVIFGHYPQNDENGTKKDPIEWFVLEKNNGKALLLSKSVLDCKKMYSEYVGCDYHGMRPYKNSTWEDSELREWLNKEFLNKAFDEESQAFIIESQVENDVMRGKAIWCVENNIEKTNDKIFCLSNNEIFKYFKFKYSDEPIKSFKSNITKYAISKGAEGDYWLRDGLEPDCIGNYMFHTGNIDGYFEDRSLCNNDKVGVRPAVWVKYAKSDNSNEEILYFEDQEFVLDDNSDAEIDFGEPDNN